MDHIWQEMAETMMARDRLAFAHDCEPPDLAAAMADAWGQDRAAAVWKLEDVLGAAEYYEVEITNEEARGLMRQLVGHLESYNGEEVLADLIGELEDDNDSNNE